MVWVLGKLLQLFLSVFLFFYFSANYFIVFINFTEFEFYIIYLFLFVLSLATRDACCEALWLRLL